MIKKEIKKEQNRKSQKEDFMSIQDRILESLSKKLEWQWHETEESVAQTCVRRQWPSDSDEYTIYVLSVSSQIVGIICAYTLKGKLDPYEFNWVRSLGKDFEDIPLILSPACIEDGDFQNSYRLVVAPIEGVTVEGWINIIEENIKVLVGDIALFVTALEKIKAGTNPEDVLRHVKLFYDSPVVGNG